jgi:Fe-S oxidoreductase
LNFATNLSFKSEIGNGFVRAAERCIGMGKCRSMHGATMCPSYRGTLEERYSTRGRGRLLQEMLRGELITEGWQSEDVKEALEWCLACKGCASDCPTHTDMAAYKAEFLSHYYEQHRRPRQAFTMGRIGEWAPYASVFPRLSNLLAPLGKSLAGVAKQRELPRFAPRTFRSQFKPSGKGRRVVLFDDTFNNHFRPRSALAAQRLLESAGCAVELPAERLCCGRPYYDFGMLDRAKRTLERALRVLPRDVPVVVLEPGCRSVFRDELKKILPGASVPAVSLAELLAEMDYRPPALERQVLVHGHCHQKALGGLAPDLRLLKAAKCEVLAPDTGCCGMAGSFGYRPEFYDASKRIAELALLPALRASPGAAVVADGFSCREQIEGLAGRKTLHLAELLGFGDGARTP